MVDLRSKDPAKPVDPKVYDQPMFNNQEKSKEYLGGRKSQHNRSKNQRKRRKRAENRERELAAAEEGDADQSGVPPTTEEPSDQELEAHSLSTEPSLALAAPTTPLEDTSPPPTLSHTFSLPPPPVPATPPSHPITASSLLAPPLPIPTPPPPSLHLQIDEGFQDPEGAPTPEIEDPPVDEEPPRKRARGRPPGATNKPIPVVPAQTGPKHVVVGIARSSGPCTDGWRARQLQKMADAKAKYEDNVLKYEVDEYHTLTWASVKATQRDFTGKIQASKNGGKSLDTLCSVLPMGSTLILMAQGIDGIATNASYYQTIAAKRQDLGLFVVLCMQQWHNLGVLHGADGPFGDQEWSFFTVAVNDLDDPDACRQGGRLHELFEKWATGEKGREEIGQVAKEAKPGLNRGRGMLKPGTK